MKLTTVSTFALLMISAAPAFAQAPEGQPGAMQEKTDRRGEAPFMPGAMMGGGPMMGGRPMMGEMGSACPMPMMSGMMTDHVEGRLAFLKTELQITDAQMPQWSVFADAFRANAKRMNALRSEMMQLGGMGMMSLSLPERMDRMEKFLSSRLEALQAMSGALQPLYAVLSDEQKKTADILIHGPMGMM